MEILRLTDICKDYQQGKEPVRVLKHINMSVQKGDYLAIMGPSGSGKTTLMNLIGCLDVPTSGSYVLEGQDLKDLSDDHLADIRNKHIGFVFQSFHLLPQLTALENVELPLIYRGMPEKQRRRLAQDNLRRVGLEERMNHRPSELSGGQQQRVAIARALAGNTPMLLADEPTGNLDSSAGKDIMSLLHELHNGGTTVIIITHDPAIGAACPRRLMMADGRLSEG